MAPNGKGQLWRTEEEGDMMNERKKAMQCKEGITKNLQSPNDDAFPPPWTD